MSDEDGDISTTDKMSDRQTDRQRKKTKWKFPLFNIYEQNI